ncbi:hypothetical protein ABXT00_14005 [Stenotrophomonas koreensis]|uniref:hypothetical protein n=1 Tax=Stenotrophomonas koreensis TaxID=266128 RepID=UPI003391E0ED
MRNLILAAVIMASLSACSTMTPARYSPSADNQVALRSISDGAAHVVQIVSSADYSASCRMAGPIQASDGMTIPQFVQKAINDELKMAGIYSEQRNPLSGEITKIAFSSTAGLTNGWWNIALTLKGSSGQSVSAEVTYNFKSGFDAMTACNQTAQALGPAVQDLIKQLVSDPRFTDLIRSN